MGHRHLIQSRYILNSRLLGWHKEAAAGCLLIRLKLQRSARDDRMDDTVSLEAESRDVHRNSRGSRQRKVASVR